MSIEKSETALERTEEPAAKETTPSEHSSPGNRAVKRVFVVRNGDIDCIQHRIVVPRRFEKNWTAILAMCDVCGATGGVYRLIEPEEEKKPTSYDELEDGKLYVGLNMHEPYKRIPYNKGNDSSRSSSPRRKAPDNRSLQATPRNNGPKVPSRYKEKNTLYRLKIFVNKSNIVRPFVVNINMTELIKASSQLENKICSPLEFVFRRIEQSCSLCLPGNKPIRRMYTIHGVEIEDPNDLVSEDAYVVAGNEAFVDLRYEERSLRSVMHHGHPDRKSLENTKYLGNLPSANKVRYSQQSRKAAEKQLKKNYSQISERSERSMDSLGYGGDHHTRNGNQSNGHNTYEEHREEREEEIPRFGDEGAPKLIESSTAKPSHDMLSAEFDQKEEENNNVKGEEKKENEEDSLNGGGTTARDNDNLHDEDAKEGEAKEEDQETK